jgi:hypothetical protein
MTHRVSLVIIACLTAGAVVVWVLKIGPRQRHSAFCQVTAAELKSLAQKRPPDITREQWQHIVAWTLNGHGNILTFKTDIPQAEQDRFVSELRGRLSSQRVDLATIAWIWDQFERLSPSYGPEYSARYRPTAPERLKEFQKQGFSWVGIEVN